MAFCVGVPDQLSVRKAHLAAISRERLAAMVEEATVDCYNESEKITGWFTMIDANLVVPFETKVLGVAVTVESVDVTENDQIVAICTRDDDRLSLPILDLPLPTPAPHGADWIEAFRQWLGRE